MKTFKTFFFIIMALLMFYIAITTIYQHFIFEGICYFLVSLSLLMLSLLESETQN